MLSRAGIFLTLPAPVLRGEEVLRPLGYTRAAADLVGGISG